MNPTTELPPNVVSALSQGRKIEAIKMLRESSGLGLKDAKETVEAYADSRPEVGARLAAANREGVGSFLRWVAFAVAAAITWFWWGGTR
jgi:translation elongation factor EF-Ts